MGKKEFRNQLEAKLETSIAEFSKGLSEKKFKKLVKKAGKLLSEGLFMAEEKIIEAVKKNDSIIFNKSKNMYRISCETLRQILSDLSKSNTKDPLTQYNKCIPYIRQLIGGPKIPFISSDDYEHLLEKFIKVISCFIVVQTDSPKNNNIIKGKSKKNRSYYLYFLYNIILFLHILFFILF